MNNTINVIIEMIIKKNFGMKQINSNNCNLDCLLYIIWIVFKF